MLYDPTSDRWTNTGSLSRSHYQQTATLLNNGHVLIAGGKDEDLAEVYNPTTGSWKDAGNMEHTRLRPFLTAACSSPAARSMAASSRQTSQRTPQNSTTQPSSRWENVEAYPTLNLRKAERAGDTDAGPRPPSHRPTSDFTMAQKPQNGFGSGPSMGMIGRGEKI